MLSSTSGEPCLGLEPAPNSGLVSILRLFLDRGGADRIAIEVEYQSSKKYCFIPLLMCFAPDEFCLSDRFTVWKRFRKVVGVSRGGEPAFSSVAPPKLYPKEEIEIFSV